MQSMDWDIFRYVIAVADNGSAVAAAKVLGVDGTTVSMIVVVDHRASQTNDDNDKEHRGVGGGKISIHDVCTVCSSRT